MKFLLSGFFYSALIIFRFICSFIVVYINSSSFKRKHYFFELFSFTAGMNRRYRDLSYTSAFHTFTTYSTINIPHQSGIFELFPKFAITDKTCYYHFLFWLLIWLLLYAFWGAYFGLNLLFFCSFFIWKLKSLTEDFSSFPL